MKITKSHFKIIEHLLPLQWGNVKIPNVQIINAVLYVAEHGCKWRGLPECYGNWHSIYTRVHRWAKNGVLDHVFGVLQDADVINIQVDAVSLDSAIIQVHPGRHRRIKKTVHKRLVTQVADGQLRFTW